MDFDYLSTFGDEAVKRFVTLTLNIKARSNSFYDAYLDLQETVVKAALTKGNYPVPLEKNSGYLLHGAEVKRFLSEVYGVEPTLLEKLHDHTLKANKHKHEKEKRVDINSVLAFMEPFYVFSRFCAGMTAVGNYSFDQDYFISIYGQLENENRQLRREVENLLRKAETMVLEHNLTQAELEACKDRVLSLDTEKADLEEENKRIKETIVFLTNVTAKRVDALEQKVEELDEKIAWILNTDKTVHIAPNAAPSTQNNPQDEGVLNLVGDFFDKAKLYFSDSPNGPVKNAQGKMMRRGIYCGFAGLATFILALCLPSSYKAYLIVGLVMISYGVLMFLIGWNTSKYEMQDPKEFWIMARGEAAFRDSSVYAVFYPARWRWITTLLFVVSLLGVLSMDGSMLPLGTQGNGPALVASIVMTQSLISIIILIMCIAVTGKSYQFRFVIYQKDDDVIRFDRKTKQWASRDKKLKGTRL